MYSYLFFQNKIIRIRIRIRIHWHKCGSQYHDGVIWNLLGTVHTLGTYIGYMYIQKFYGPKTEPCGTPQTNLAYSETIPSI